MSENRIFLAVLEAPLGSADSERVIFMDFMVVLDLHFFPRRDGRFAVTVRSHHRDDLSHPSS
jgi:hypothetical protein